MMIYYYLDYTAVPGIENRKGGCLLSFIFHRYFALVLFYSTVDHIARSLSPATPNRS